MALKFDCCTCNEPLARDFAVYRVLNTWNQPYFRFAHYNCVVSEGPTAERVNMGVYFEYLLANYPNITEFHLYMEIDEIVEIFRRHLQQLTVSSVIDS